jgi:arsenate reductase
MAEGLARVAFRGRAEVVSAGSRPSFVHPLAVEALKEIGIDISRSRSKSTDEIDFSRVDLVVTLCAEEVCPLVPAGTRKLHWPLRDPAGGEGSVEDRLERFRAIRDELRTRLETLAHDELRAL